MIYRNLLTSVVLSSPVYLPRNAVAFSTNAKNIVNWGIISTGKISNDFVNAMKITEGSSAAAVAARSSTSAQKFADSHDIAKVHESYESLVNDPEIDVVYIGTVAETHYDLVRMCLEARKPTIVEKPMSLNSADAQNLVSMARSNNVFFMEGMWSRFFPAVRKAREIVESGAIGDIVCVQGDFGWNTKDCDPNDRMWNPLSGGMTYDIGMYLAMLGQVAFPRSTVENVQAMCSSKRNGVDQTVLGNILFSKFDDNVGGVGPKKGALQFYVTGDANTEERTVIQGTKGRITITPPAHTPDNIKVSYDTGRGEFEDESWHFPLPDDSWAHWNYPRSIGFTYQIGEVSKCIREGKIECEHFTHSDSLQVSSILDQILGQIGHAGADARAEDKRKEPTQDVQEEMASAA